MSMPAITVCIPTVRPDTLGATIASIRAQTWEDWELLVIGQGDEGALRRATLATAAGDRRVGYVHLPQRGLSRARNAGLRAAAGGLVAMIDDDCEARADWLAVLAACFAREAAVGVVGGSLLAPPPARPGPSSCISVVPDEVIYDPVATPPPAPPGFDWYGANFAIRAAVARRVGPFDEELGVGGPFLAAEDYDYKLRLEDAGVAMWATPRAVVFHTHGRRYGLRELVRYWHRNAYGEGALAAKRAGMGDPRGAIMVRHRVRDLGVGWLAPPRPHRLPGNLVRLQAFLRGYGAYRRAHRAVPPGCDGVGQ